MAYSSDQSQLAFVNEATQGTTPINPSLYLARFGSESMGLDVNTTESIELNPNRGVTDAVLAGATAGGTMECELVSNDLFEDLFSSVHGADFVVDDLDVGNLLKTWTIEKGFDPSGAAPYFQTYTGTSISSYSLSIAPNTPVGLSFAFVGGQLGDPIGGVTIGTGDYAAETQGLAASPVMVAHRSSTTWGLGADGICITALDMTVDSQNRGIQCISDLGDKEVALGKLKITGSASVYFANNAVMQEFIDAAEQTLDISIKDKDAPPAEHTYTWSMPRVKWTAGATNITGSGEDIINQMEFEALVDDTLGRSIRFTRATVA